MTSLKQRISSLFQSRWIPWCAAASIVASLISIAAAYILAGVALLLWVIDTLRRRRLRLRWPPFALPLLLFVISMGIAVLFSEDPATSSGSLKKLVRFLFVPLMFTWFGTVHVKWTVRRIYWVVGASAVYALAQYYWLMEPDLQHRITGFMGHWMTFSGQLMMGAVSLGVFLCRERFTAANSSTANREETGWRRLPVLGLLLLLLLSWSLLVTFTRNAWLGTAAGGLLLVVLTKKTRVLLLLLALMALLIVVPTPFRDRLLSGVDLSDTTTQVRLEMVQAGSRLIRDHPWTGVGPGMVYREVLKYRSHQEYPDWAYQHLHNNFLQVAAETGLVGLAFWLALWIVLIRDLIRMWLRSESEWVRFLSLNGLCISAAFHVAGCLEYNFGDSEVLILLLFFLTAPYAVQRRELAQKSPTAAPPA